MALLPGMVPLHSDISFQNTCDLHHKFGDFSFLLLILFIYFFLLVSVFSLSVI